MSLRRGTSVGCNGMRSGALWRELTNVRATRNTLLAGVAGLVLFSVADGSGYLARGLQAVAAACIGAAVVLIVDLQTRRDLRAETLIDESLRTAVLAAGLRGIDRSLDAGGVFERLSSARAIDVSMSGNATWVHRNFNALQQAVGRRGCDVRVLLPDVTRPELVSELERRYRDPGDVVPSVQATAARLLELFSGGRVKARVHLHFGAVAPTAAYYRVDVWHVVQPLPTGRVTDGNRRPVFTFDHQGHLADFYRADFEACWIGSRTSECPSCKD